MLAAPSRTFSRLKVALSVTPPTVAEALKVTVSAPRPAVRMLTDGPVAKLVLAAV